MNSFAKTVSSQSSLSKVKDEIRREMMQISGIEMVTVPSRSKHPNVVYKIGKFSQKMFDQQFENFMLDLAKLRFLMTYEQFSRFYSSLFGMDQLNSRVCEEMKINFSWFDPDDFLLVPIDVEVELARQEIEKICLKTDLYT